MSDTSGTRGMGWIPDYPDFRDYTERSDEVKSVLEPTGVLKAKSLPDILKRNFLGYPSPNRDHCRLEVSLP